MRLVSLSFVDGSNLRAHLAVRYAKVSILLSPPKREMKRTEEKLKANDEVAFVPPRGASGEKSSLASTTEMALG